MRLIHKPPTSVSRIIASGLVLGVVGLCGWYIVLRPLGESLCLIRPDSLRDPVILPGAEEIEFGRPSFKPDDGHEAKLIQFQTADKPESVYEFYKQSLVHDRWLEDEAQHVTIDSNRVDAKFNWACGFDTPNTFSTLWFHSEAIGSGKIVVTLILEYLP